MPSGMAMTAVQRLPTVALHGAITLIATKRTLGTATDADHNGTCVRYCGHKASAKAADMLEMIKTTTAPPDVSYVAMYKVGQRTTFVSSIIMLAQVCFDFTRHFQTSSDLPDTAG